MTSLVLNILESVCQNEKLQVGPYGSRIADAMPNNLSGFGDGGAV